MALNIEVFSNEAGGNAFFKAIGHPLAARKGMSLRLRGVYARVVEDGRVTAGDRVVKVT